MRKMFTNQLKFTGNQFCRKGAMLFFAFLFSVSFAKAQTQECEDWQMFYADVTTGNNTDIYSVEFEDDDANLSLIATSEIQVHIAYNESDGLIYAVSNTDGSYTTLDPESDSPMFSEPVMIDADIDRVTQAAFDLDGNLVIGNSGSDLIYSVDLSDNSVTLLDSDSPIEGGDIVYGLDGTPYMATKENGGKLYTLAPEGMEDVEIGDLPGSVTGMALSANNDLLASFTGGTELMIRDLDGTNNGDTYALLLNGEPFTMGAGDMASGCASSNNEEGECQAFSTYYMDNATDAPTLYGVEFSGSEAMLEPITGSDFRAHIAFNAQDGVVYFVNRNGNNVTFFDLEAGYIADLAIDGGLSGTHSAVYNPADGLLYVGSSSDDKIYTVDLTTGASTQIADAPAQGGDLSLQDGMLYLAVRGANELYTIADGSATFVGAIPGNASGMARANNTTSLIISKANSSTFREVGLDGADIVTYEAMLFGESFSLASGGDMAAGCADDNNNEDDCENFNTYYANHGSGISGTDLYSVVYDGSNANLSFLDNVDFQAHIGYNGDEDILYLVNANGSAVTLYSPEAGIIGEVDIVGDLDQLFAVVYNSADGLLYVGDDNDNAIYTVDLTTGVAEFYSEGAVNGGDLSLQGGVLYLADRTNHDLYEVVEGGANILVGDLPSEVNGMARANNATGLVVARAETGMFVEVGTDGAVVQEYAAMLDGESFILANGDMAAGCADGSINLDDCNYQLYYTHQPVEGGSYELYGVTLNEEGIATVEFIDDLGGAHIALTPDGSQLYIVSGSNVRTYTFGVGVVNDVNIFNGANDANLSGFPAAVADANGNLFIAGAGNNVWQVDPMTGEATNVASGINVDGGDLIFAPTGVDGEDELWIITRGNNTFTRVLDPENGSFSVDVNEMNGAAVLANGNVIVADGDLDGEAGFIEINLATLEMTEYDVDLPLYNGDFAGGCTVIEEEDDDQPVVVQSVSLDHVLSSYPNPTEGQSNVVFELADTQRILLEVFDMSGRSVETLFSQVANAGQEYILNFDGTDLPNGVYMYRMTLENEVVIEKFMIAR